MLCNEDCIVCLFSEVFVVLRVVNNTEDCQNLIGILHVVCYSHTAYLWHMYTVG